MNLIREIIEETGSSKSGRKELRQFGLTMGAILVILGVVFLLRGRAYYLYVIGVSATFFGLGLFAPDTLKVVQKIWITLGLVLGFFVSRILLALLFYGMVTPMALIAKALGKDLLDERMDRHAASYWRKRETTVKDKKSYESQF